MAKKQSDKVVAFLPAKGTSSRVTNKNTRSFNGEPLFAFTLRKLLRCNFIDEVYLDSECQEILSYGHRLGAKTLQRDAALATNATDGNALFYNEVLQVDADIYIQVLCTSPFIKPETIQHAVEALSKDIEIDSVVLVKEEKRYPWSQGKPLYDIEKIPNSFELPTEVSEAMGLYVVRGSAAHDTRRRIGNAPKALVGSPIELVDINTDADLDLALTIARGILAEEERTLRLLSTYLSSPILSDICDELGLCTVLSPLFEANIPGAKMFGRARTLHIRSAVPSDPTDSIYKALESYRDVVTNDIIVVQNDEGSLAYFGEINMSLAIRSGAKGALVGGVTRDSSQTRAAGFPVYSRGSYCRDIKGRGALASMNQVVKIDSVEVCPNDLVFADSDGVVIIPSSVEQQVLREALAVLQKERCIVADICSNVPVDMLISNHGFF